jgi:hypothetical protein
VIDTRQRFLENLKTFLVQFGGIQRNPGQIAVRRAKTGHQTAPDGIANRRENNRDGRCCALGLSGGCHADNHDHVGCEFDDLCRSPVERLCLFVGKAILDHNVPAIDVAQVTKALVEGVDKVLGPGRRKIHDQRGRSLCARFRRPDGRDASQQCNELSTFQSITYLTRRAREPPAHYGPMISRLE